MARPSDPIEIRGRPGMRGVTSLPAYFPTPKRPHRCPICQGCGTVPPDFYTQLGVGTNTARETCRACDGQGIVIA